MAKAAVTSMGHIRALSFIIGCTFLFCNIGDIQAISSYASEPAEAQSDGIAFVLKVMNENFAQTQLDSLRAWGGHVGDLETETIARKGSPLVITWFIIAGTATVTALAETVASLILDYKESGCLIDFREKNVVIKPVPSIERGHCFIITPDGKFEDVKAAPRDNLTKSLVQILDKLSAILDKLPK